LGQGATLELVPLGGARTTATLKSIDADGRATFLPANSLPVAEIVRWGNPLDPRPQPIVLLNDGSRIVAAAAWSGAAPVTLAEGHYIVKSDLIDDARIPRGLVYGIVFAERSHSSERQRLEKAIRAAVTAGLADDEILLTNDDRQKGKVLEIAEGTLTLATDLGNAKFPLSRIQSVALTDPKTTSPFAIARLQIGLRDGSQLPASSVIADEKSLTIQVAVSGLTLTGGTAADVVALQSLDPSRLAYLSDLEPSGYRHVPYLSIEWPYECDHNVRGGPLVVGGNRYWKGLGMHSAARLTYSLDPAAGWRRFEASVAVDDSAGGRGSVTFGIHVLRGGGWQTAYNSEIIRGGQSPVDVSVDVSGAIGLTLTVDFADRGDELDHADWLDARLVK
jgi:hypothetical protein